MKTQRPRVLLADDHRMFAEGLRRLIEPAVEVVGIATDGRELLASVAAERPDIVVCDLSMPELDGLEATRQLLASEPGIKVVALSMHADRSHVREAFRAGACGYVVKSAAPDEIETALSVVLKGECFASPAVTRHLVDAVGNHRAPGMASEEAPAGASATVSPAGGHMPKPATETPLTPREVEISSLVARGWTNQKIADRLALSEATVRTHLKHIFRKLELNNRVELALYAVRAGVAVNEDSDGTAGTRA